MITHPDCLICPEEWYGGAFVFPSLGINDPAYQYDRVGCRYTELRNPWMGPFAKPAELAAVPTAFTLINVADGGTPLTADQLDEPDVSTPSRTINAFFWRGRGCRIRQTLPW